MANFILKFLRYLDARQPMTSKEVKEILEDKELSEKFFAAIKESRSKGEKVIEFTDNNKKYTIELVKDLSPV
ncbi:MAG: hypothetical protein M9901_07810 [Lentimicrobium sp.]|nr:hypothetical protein [Lentimicrobium sp.]